jgi:SAM-dependent methyltransferase
MSTPAGDAEFVGSIPTFYETYLVPLIFEPFAADLADRLASKPPSRLLEIATGTGVVTRALDSRLPQSVSIVASDLNQAMLDEASKNWHGRAVVWQQADAVQLPFEDDTFDAVVCQFGAMFFPEKAKAFAEIRRVLAPGGTFIFNVWDRIEDNEFADAVTVSLEPLYPSDPPRFLPRVPYGYFDREVIARDLARGGFTAAPIVDTVSARSRAESARIPAVAFCQGCPLRAEIEARSPWTLDEATAAAAEGVARRFGREHVDGKIQAVVVTVER